LPRRRSVEEVDDVLGRVREGLRIVLAPGPGTVDSRQLDLDVVYVPEIAKAPLSVVEVEKQLQLGTEKPKTERRDPVGTLHVDGD